MSPHDLPRRCGNADRHADQSKSNLASGSMFSGRLMRMCWALDVRACVGQQADRQALANCKPRRAQPFIPSVIVRLPVGQAATQQRMVARMGGWALIRATTSGDTARLRAYKLEVTCSLTSLPAR